MNDHDPGIVDFEPELRDLVAELFPVEVALPDGRVVLRGKVFVLSGGVLVYGEESGRPALMFRSRHAAQPELANPVAPKRRQLTTVTTTDGVVRVQGILGCGCGSPLKTFTHTDALADASADRTA